MEDLKHIIGQNIRYYRKIAGISQEKLAEATGLHRTFIGGVERGDHNVSVANITKIAGVLCIEPFVLLIKHTDTRAFMALAEHMEERAK